MLISENIQPALFEAFFRPVIRVRFNWDRFVHEQWPVDLIAFDRSDGFSKFRLPWYVSAEGQEVQYNNPDAKSFLHLSEIPASLKSLSQSHQESIEEYRQTYEIGIKPIQFAVGVYKIPGDEFLILDGCHRMAAISILDCDFVVLGFNVNGPVDEDVVPDLIHA